MGPHPKMDPYRSLIEAKRKKLLDLAKLAFMEWLMNGVKGEGCCVTL
jgi:hypothetical protein